LKIKSHPLKSIITKINHGLTIETGPFRFKIQTSDVKVASYFYNLYADFTYFENDDFFDFSVSVNSPNLIRKWILPNVSFSFDGFHPFKPLPKNHSYPLFEWGMNWCIATNAHQYLIIHAAVIEKDNISVILPAPPGSGKSTLCAALVNRGWRLLSDELTLVSVADGLIYPLARPINLKNDSIDIIKKFAPSSYFSPSFFDTHKGTVALMKPPLISIEKIKIPAQPSFIIFPTYSHSSNTILNPLSPTVTFKDMIGNSFNYDVLSLEGFHTMSKLINSTKHFTLQYSSLNEAIELFNSLSKKITCHY